MKESEMSRMLYFFFVIYSIFSLKVTYSSVAPSVTVTPLSSSEKKEEHSVHPLALSWEADLNLVNFNTSQEQKIRNAVAIIKKVIISQEFKRKVLNFEYNGDKKFVDNHGLTNEEIYNMIFEGAEKIGNMSKNNAMNVELELYHQKTNTIGYTYPNTVRIWINKKYFSKYSPIKVADNLMHEWMHKLGFTHATKWSRERDHSVPYAVGYIIEELAGKLTE
jgi:hypothetical protein